MSNRIFSFLVLFVWLQGSHTGWAQEKMDKGAMMEKSLYLRLGGYDAIAAVTDDFIGRLVNDKTLSRFFGGASMDTQKRFRQLLVDQLCAVTWRSMCLYRSRYENSAWRAWDYGG